MVALTKVADIKNSDEGSMFSDHTTSASPVQSSHSMVLEEFQEGLSENVLRTNQGNSNETDGILSEVSGWISISALFL